MNLQKLTHIKEHLGIRYRQLLRLSGLANGFSFKILNQASKSKEVRIQNNKILANSSQD
jgi:hypothetical protein